ncbi:MAG: AAA family ATPase [Cyanobacteria bacterium Co-bin13]|nr:AAA family ATPase [Cyanobacteria bacterium Co-bin13]
MTPTAPVPLILLIGLPGSGKSTWAKNFVFQFPAYHWVATDGIRQRLYGDEAEQGDWMTIWRTVQAEWRADVAAICQGQLAGTVYDATNVRRRGRRDAIATARQIGFTHITACWFDVPLAVCLQRNRQRARQVPEEVMQRMHRQLTGAPPSAAEGFDQLARLITTPWAVNSPRPTARMPLPVR